MFSRKEFGASNKKTKELFSPLWQINWEKLNFHQNRFFFEGKQMKKIDKVLFRHFSFFHSTGFTFLLIILKTTINDNKMTSELEKFFLTFSKKNCWKFFSLFNSLEECAQLDKKFQALKKPSYTFFIYLFFFPHVGSSETCY